MSTQIKIRRDTAANWTTANPILGQGEPALETDTLLEKIGDGTTVWTSLPYKVVGTGDVVGPGSATDENIAVFDSTTGKLIKDGGIHKSSIVALTDNVSPYNITETNLDNVSSKNAVSALTIPTSDTSGEAVHPSVLYFKDGWNGYKYWMVMTPYPNYDETYENPEIVVSNDNVTWVVPGGGSNPIVPKPVGGFNADAELVYDYVADKIWVVYLEHTTVGGDDAFNVLSSSDGTTWSSVTEIFNDSVDSLLILSPSVIFDGTTFTMYYIQMNSGSYTDVRLYKRTATAMDGTWSSATLCTVDTIPSGKALWHLSVNKLNNETHLFLVLGDAGTGFENTEVYFAKSINSEDFFLKQNPIISLGVSTGWDSYAPYRGSAVYFEDRNAYGFWYSGVDDFPPATSVWGIGYTEILLDSPTAVIGETTTLDISNSVPNLYYMTAATSNTTFTVSRRSPGGKAIVLVNAATAPHVTDGVNISTFDFIPDTNMYMHVQYFGSNVEYYFIPFYNVEQGFPNIGGSSFVGTTISLNTEGVNPYGCIMNEDNTKMWVALGATTIFQYTVTPGDPYTMVYASKSFNYSADAGSCNFLAFNDDFTKLTIGASYAAPAKVLASYTLTGQDISTCSLVEAYTNSIYFHDMIWLDSGNSYACVDVADAKKLKVYPVSTPYLPSTVGALTGSVTLSEISGNIIGFRMSANKDKLYAVDYSNNIIYQYTLTTADDPLTAIYENHSYTVDTSVDNLFNGIFFTSSMDRWFGFGLQKEDIYEFSF